MKALLTFMAAALVLPSIAFAAPPAAVRAACASDGMRLCGSTVGNPQAHRACMMEHRAELSDRCRGAIAEFRGKQRGGTKPLASAGQHSMSGGACAFKFHGECRSAAWMRRRERCAAEVQERIHRPIILEVPCGGREELRIRHYKDVCTVKRCERLSTTHSSV